MGYEVALTWAWSELSGLTLQKNHSVFLLADEYDVDLKNKRILSQSCNIPEKTHTSILILHYLARRLKGLSALTGDWIPFNRLAGGEGYYTTFKKRVIGTIIKKYGSCPEAIFARAQNFRTKKAQFPDISLIVEVFAGVPILITLQRQDEEFGPEVNVLFDSSIEDIFCTEDVVVLAEFVAANI